VQPLFSLLDGPLLSEGSILRGSLKPVFLVEFPEGPLVDLDVGSSDSGLLLGCLEGILVDLDVGSSDSGLLMGCMDGILVELDVGSSDSGLLLGCLEGTLVDDLGIGSSE